MNLRAVSVDCILRDGELYAFLDPADVRESLLAQGWNQNAPWCFLMCAPVFRLLTECEVYTDRQRIKLHVRTDRPDASWLGPLVVPRTTSSQGRYLTQVRARYKGQPLPEHEGVGDVLYDFLDAHGWLDRDLYVKFETRGR